MKTDDQAIRDVHATWISAVNAGDLAQLLTLMADDAVLVNPGNAPLDRSGFSAGFLDAHRKFKILCISELENIVINGNVAYAMSQDSLSLSTRSDGQITQLAGHRLTIYRKHTDDRWLLARDANTLAPTTR